MKTLSERMCARLAAVGITQEQLGQLVGISQTAVRKLMTGDSKTTRHIFKIAEVLGVNADWLANGDGEMGALSISDVQRNAETGLLLKIVESLPDDERRALISYLRARARYLCSQKNKNGLDQPGSVERPLGALGSDGYSDDNAREA